MEIICRFISGMFLEGNRPRQRKNKIGLWPSSLNEGFKINPGELDAGIDFQNFPVLGASGRSFI